MCPSLTTSQHADGGNHGHDFSSGSSLCGCPEHSLGEGGPPAAILPQQLAWAVESSSAPASRQPPQGPRSPAVQSWSPGRPNGGTWLRCW